MTKVHFRLPSVANKRPAILNKLIGTLQPFLSKCGMQNIFQGKTGLSILPSPLPPINVERSALSITSSYDTTSFGANIDWGEGGGGKNEMANRENDARCSVPNNLSRIVGLFLK